jgi:hypothetical protein
MMECLKRWSDVSFVRLKYLADSIEDFRGEWRVATTCGNADFPVEQQSDHPPESKNDNATRVDFAGDVVTNSERNEFFITGRVIS